MFICPKCGEKRVATRHHVFPRRFFGKKNNHEVVHLCRACHNRLELLIPRYEQMPREWYQSLITKFLEGGTQ